MEAPDPRAPSERERAAVELSLDIDRDGAVTAVKVSRSAGEALDQAAVAAAGAFTFEPATRDGVPVAARLRYEYVFSSVTPEPAPPPPPAQAPVAIADPAPLPAATDAPAAPDPESFAATARADAPPREVTKRTLARDELTRVAGTRGDPLRAVELLPGVSRPAGNGGMPILRGANPDDSQVFVEGAMAPYLYHLGGFTSIVHARVLESVDLYPSNFSVRYGRKTGGVIEATLRDPRTDRFHGTADVSLIDSSLVLETPIGDKLGVLAAVRRSNIDAVLNSAASTADLAITAAPVYWDYQAVAAYRPTDEDRIRLLAFGSSDRFAVVLANPSESDPSLRGYLGAETVFHRVQLGYRHRFRGGSETNTTLTYGREYGTGSFGAIAGFTYDVHDLLGRSEWVSVISPALRLVAGVDVTVQRYSGTYGGVATTAGEGDQPLTFANARRVTFNADDWVTAPAAYLEAGIRPVPTLLLVPGVRADHTSTVDRASVDPRLSARWDITDATTLKGGAGKFTQPPRGQDVIVPLGNPGLRLTKALHVSAGVEQKIGGYVSASAEGFAKWIDDMVTGTPDSRAPHFENSQTGRIFGAELLVRVKPTGRFFGFVSYTLMRSERKTAGEERRLFDRDQPHILNATGTYRLGRGWEVGASFRYTSGTPYTPVATSTYESISDTYQPRLGSSMSARNPGFSRFDLRIEKKWTFAAWNFAIYLDVQNVLNAENREGYSYNYDYTRREGVRGLPVFPSLGIRGEL